MRYLIVSASMGAGHDGVARELASRLSSAGHDAKVVDLIQLEPYGTGVLLRWFYSAMVRYVPWLYELIYRIFFVPHRVQPTASPAVRLALPQLRRVVAQYQPDATISTFHLAAQALGELRQRGQLPVPSIVVLVDFAVHKLWLHPGTDLYLCTHPAAAEAVRAALGKAARATGPVVPGGFHACAAIDSDRPAVRRRLGLPEIGRLVIVAGGSLGVGHGVRSAARALAGSGRYVPVVLCGRNERLRRRLAGDRGVVALGWVDDVPALFGVACALVENGGGGATCAEAFAAGLPVVTYRPIPGHGRAGARELVKAGVATLVSSEADLIGALDALTVPGPARDGQIAAARALFTEDPASVIADMSGSMRAGPVLSVETRPAAREAWTLHEPT